MTKLPMRKTKQMLAEGLKAGRYGPRDTLGENFAFWQGIATGETRLDTVELPLCWQGHWVELPDLLGDFLDYDDVNEAGKAKIAVEVDRLHAEIRALAVEALAGASSAADWSAKIMAALSPCSMELHR